MPGFIRSPFTDINQLRSLFDNEMDERLVLKELIQNADDSGATFIAVGCSPGIQEADHPLLKAPALFAVNDGPLLEEHARAIISLGLSTKGDDAGTVGKFGLGLKSVFFLAEALFFMDARLDPEERWRHPHFDILSPWLASDKPLHPGWSVFSPADRARVLEHLRALGIPTGFAVWVPLRRAEDCRDSKTSRFAPIIPNYPGDEAFSLPQELVRGLSSLLPLLGHVKRIVVYPDMKDLRFRTTFEQSGGSRTSNLNDMPPGEARFLGKIAQAPGNLISNYTGTEALLSHVGIRNLQNDKMYWPKTAVDTPFGRGGPLGRGAKKATVGPGERARARGRRGPQGAEKGLRLSCLAAVRGLVGVWVGENRGEQECEQWGHALTLRPLCKPLVKAYGRLTLGR